MRKNIYPEISICPSLKEGFGGILDEEIQDMGVLVFVRHKH
jgi:hypothetical protein